MESNSKLVRFCVYGGIMYTERHIENILKKAVSQTKVVLLTGARQVGKSTSIRRIFPDYQYITLDDENELELALRDRSLFFKDKAFPIIIDEVQYAGELMREVKRIADQSDEKGRILLTGSQTYDLLDQASRSLVGRVSIVELSSLSCREIFGVKFQDCFLPDPGYLKQRKKNLVHYDHLWEHIHRGFMPELLDAERDAEWFYRDYIRTYIERDIRRIVNVKDEMKFRSFMVSLAARSAQIVNYDDIAKDVGVDIKTVQHWMSVVEASGLVKIIHPYFNNAIKRATKAPKLFFMDTGLLCYLVGWKTYESAQNGTMAGSIFETFVVSEIIKSYLNAGKNLDHLYFYRDKEKREIDLLIEDGDTLYPVEIKKGATVQQDWTKNFSVLNKISDKKIGQGCVICRVDTPVPVDEQSMAIPVEYI